MHTMATRLLCSATQARKQLVRVLGSKPCVSQEGQCSKHSATSLVSLNEKRDFSTATKIPDSARVVICGGGVIGVSIAYHLADKGWNDVVLLEQGSLTCGTTWHSAGLIGQVRDTRAYTNLMKYSRRLYIELEKTHGVGWKQCGSLSLAQTKDRMTLLARNHAIARASGVESHICTTAEIRNMCQWISTDDVVGGLWIPEDGALTAPDLVTALAKEAKSKGARIIEGVKVNSIGTTNGTVSSVDTSQGKIQCEYFVNCAGQWGRELGLRSDPIVRVPLQPMEHFYMVTAPVEGLDRMMPVIRDYDGLVYAREWSGGLLSGGFEVKGKPAFLDGIPDNFEFQLLPEDWDHFECILDPIRKRFPLMETAQIRQQLNGPESFTPDGNWNVGEVPEIRNYFVAAGMTAFGVAGAGAVGRHMSEMIVDKETSEDVPWIDVKRHSEHYNGLTFLQQRASEAICRYKLPYPGQQMASGRKLQTSPLHTELEGRGACFGEECAYEKPLWFDTKSDTPFDQYTSQSGTFGKPSWFEFVESEYKACKTCVGLVDVSSYVKFELKGSNAFQYLQKLCPINISRQRGSVARTGMHNPEGGYMSDGVILTLDSDRFLYITPSPHKTRVMSWLQKNISDRSGVELNDVTNSYSGVLLVGPKSGNVVQEASTGKIAIDHDRYQEIDIGVSSGIFSTGQTFCGENGVFLLMKSQSTLQVFESLMTTGQKHGIQMVGHLAIRQLQVENFCPHWLYELGAKTTPKIAGLSSQIDWNKGDFIGREAMLKQKDLETGEQLAHLRIEDFSADNNMWVWGGEPIYSGETCVGSVLSSGYSFSKRNMFCLVSLSNKSGTVNKDTTYDIHVSGQCYKARKTDVNPKI